MVAALAVGVFPVLCATWQMPPSVSIDSRLRMISIHTVTHMVAIGGTGRDSMERGTVPYRRLHASCHLERRGLRPTSRTMLLNGPPDLLEPT